MERLHLKINIEYARMLSSAKGLGNDVIYESFKSPKSHVNENLLVGVPVFGTRLFYGFLLL